MNPGNALEIGGYGLELNAEPSIAGNGEAVLADHGHDGASVVLEDRHALNLIPARMMQILVLGLGLSREVMLVLEEEEHPSFLWG